MVGCIGDGQEEEWRALVVFFVFSGVVWEKSSASCKCEYDWRDGDQPENEMSATLVSIQNVDVVEQHK